MEFDLIGLVVGKKDSLNTEYHENGVTRGTNYLKNRNIHVAYTNIDDLGPLLLRKNVVIEKEATIKWDSQDMFDIVNNPIRLAYEDLYKQTQVLDSDIVAIKNVDSTMASCKITCDFYRHIEKSHHSL